MDIFPKGNTMSRPMADTPKRRARRPCTDEFNASAVRLVLDDGGTVGVPARDLDLTEAVLREWVKRACADRMHGRTGLTTAGARGVGAAPQGAADRGRRPGHLKKATAFFAKQSP